MYTRSWRGKGRNAPRWESNEGRYGLKRWAGTRGIGGGGAGDGEEQSVWSENTTGERPAPYRAASKVGALGLAVRHTRREHGSTPTR